MPTRWIRPGRHSLGLGHIGPFIGPNGVHMGHEAMTHANRIASDDPSALRQSRERGSLNDKCHHNNNYDQFQV